MAGLLKFKTFKDARENSFKRMYETKISQMERFSLPGRIHYRPGLYRYRTFEEARQDDMERMIRNDNP